MNALLVLAYLSFFNFTMVSNPRFWFYLCPADSYGAFLQVNEGEPVYDFCWYPGMSLSGACWIASCDTVMILFLLWQLVTPDVCCFTDPATCVFASTSRDHPIHLWDATNGEVRLVSSGVWLIGNSDFDYLFWELQLRCTYRAYDAMDEITAALSVSFNSTGSKYVRFVQKLRLHSYCIRKFAEIYYVESWDPVVMCLVWEIVGLLWIFLSLL